MELTIDRRYLAVPVSAHAQVKKLKFMNGQGEVVFDLDVKLDPASAQFTYFADLRAFLGQTLTVACEPEVDFVPHLVDSAPRAGGERFRPAAHFTPDRGWINDPNGLVYYEGKYHLFFQHNPVGMNWGNMHWGHAVSDDLMHWEEKEIALFPDEMGTMYSGSAIIDDRNVSGLKEGEHDPILLFYTAAGDHSILSKGTLTCQCLAYSVDGGETFVKYAGNPVVPHIIGGNRDPKVVFCPEMDAYVMALYLDGNEYALFRSENLLNWTMIQKISIPKEAECPDFFPLELEGEMYWVFIGASEYYLVGKIEGGQFVPVQEAGRVKSEGSESYAAQTYSGLADNRRVRIAWNRFDLPDMAFNGSMTTPVDFCLKRIGGRIALVGNPVPEIEALYGARVSGQGCVKLPGRANDIRLRIPAACGEVQIDVCGLKITVDADKETVSVKDCVMRAGRTEDCMVLRIIQDVHATEAYSADGTGYMCIGHLADRSLNRVDAPAEVQVEAAELKSYRG